MNDYLKTLSKKQLRKLITKMVTYSEPLGSDADFRFQANDPEDEDSNPDGFYCQHSGENLLSE